MSDPIVVIGGGPNGLAAAALLARAGRTVTLLEMRHQLGGIMAGESFGGGAVNGHTHAGIVHDTSTVRPWVIDALELTAHGLELAAPAPTIAVTADRAVALGPDLPGWRSWSEFIDAVTPAARMLMDDAPQEIWSGAPLWPLVKPALAVRRLGAERMMELLRVGPLSAEDWLQEHFADPLVRVGLAVPALLGTWMGPRSPHGATALLLAASLSGPTVVGGPAALVAALVGACRRAGVTLRTDAEVHRIDVADGRVTGVTLADGSSLPAGAVLSAIGPRRTLLDLVHPRHIPPRAEVEVAKVRTRGIVAKVHLALSGPLELTAHPAPAARLVVADDPNTAERAFDDARHRRLPRAPVLDVSMLGAPHAPKGGAVASVLVHGVPFELDGGWSDAGRDALSDTVIATLARVAPSLPDQVVAREVLTPADLAERFALDGGHLFHGELALDQLHVMRPAPGLARYGTAVAGLFLGSGGCHPPGPTLGAGALAARALLAST